MGQAEHDGRRLRAGRGRLRGRALGSRGAKLVGLIGKITAKPGERAALIEALSAGSERMPGSVSYVIAEDASTADLIWVTEIWDSEPSHRASLKLPAVQEAIRRGRPLIAGFETVATTRPVAGVPAWKG